VSMGSRAVYVRKWMLMMTMRCVFVALHSARWMMCV
jgi:hypothetical protein